jgi:dUTP pyrophosphatase
MESVLKTRIDIDTKMGWLVPTRGSAEAAGWDVHSAEYVELNPGQTRMIRCGFQMRMPPGWEAQMRSRSGFAVKDSVFVLNSPGTIDSDYRGEICVVMHNAHATNYWHCLPGDRIAQMVFQRVPEIELFDDTNSVDIGETSRGASGYGSTGRI